MSKPAKEMTASELLIEIKRVEELLRNNKHPLTHKQNRKYLNRLQELYYEKIHKR